MQAAQRRRDLVVADRAEGAPDGRCRTRLFIANTTTSAPMPAIHASQRSSGKFAPSHDGGVGGLITSPLAPPNVLEYFSASAGSPIANASVAPAR